MNGAVKDFLGFTAAMAGFVVVGAIVISLFAVVTKRDSVRYNHALEKFMTECKQQNPEFVCHTMWGNAKRSYVEMYGK